MRVSPCCIVLFLICTAYNHREIQTQRQARTCKTLICVADVQYTELVKLDLAGNNITEKGTEILVESLGHISTLRVLNLSGNSIRDYNSVQPEASPLLQMLLTMTTLTDLDISRNDVSHDMAEHLVVTLGKRCQQIKVLNGREIAWSLLRTERQRREKRDQLRRTIVEPDDSSFMFRPSLRDPAKCEFCNKTEEQHFSTFRFCYLPVYTESEEENVCVHCRQPDKSHRTLHNFCFDGQRREAIEEARRKGMIKESIEEDVGKGQTPLIRAAESGDEYVVLSLLAARANIEHKDRSGRTALACAAGAKDPACMNLLLAAGSNISQANLRGQTPLHEAIVNGQEQNAWELLSTAGGPDLVVRQDSEGKTCLHCSAEKGMQLLALSLLAQGGLELLRKCTVDGRTALHFAAERGSPMLCKRMLEIGGADIAKMRSSQGRTCLHYCAQMLWWTPTKQKLSHSEDEHALLQERHQQMQDVCTSLIQELPAESLALEDESSCTALTYCAGSSLEHACHRILDRLQDAEMDALKAELKKQLEAKDAEIDALKKKVAELEAELKKLQEQLAAVKEEREKPAKEAALLAASRAELESKKAETEAAKAALKDANDEIERLNKLLEELEAAKKDHALDFDLERAIQLTTFAKELKVKVQQDKGEDQEVEHEVVRRVTMLRSVDGRTALHWASAKGLLSVAQRLVAIGGKELACIQAADGRTSLHWAASAGHEEVCCALIPVGGKELVVSASRDGWSALSWAVGSALGKAAGKMIEVGGRDLLGMRDRHGMTALHRAAWRRGETMERLCIEMVRTGGSELVGLVDKDRRTVLHIAASGCLSQLCHDVIEMVPSEMLSIQDSEGRTALHLATAAGHTMESVCHALIRKGGLDILMAKMFNGHTALHLAAQRGMVDLCVKMVHRSVWPPARTCNVSSPLVNR